MNAFKYGCSVDGENFCARPDLSKSLSTYVESGQNLVIQGERRIGKTSLVKETVSSMRGWSMLYADFMGVKSVTDVCNRVADALARFDSSDSFMRRIFAALVHLRPVATVDAMTGLPTISVDARASAAPSSVNTVMNAVEAHVKGRKACVVFDEFQDILDVKDGEHPLSGAFLEEARLTNTATVRRSLTSLERTGLVYPGPSGWKFASPFFREWMRRRK
jgi:AAA+ ATPase superfamily predicted ATPase